MEGGGRFGSGYGARGKDFRGGLSMVIGGF